MRIASRRASRASGSPSRSDSEYSWVTLPAFESPDYKDLAARSRRASALSGLWDGVARGRGDLRPVPAVSPEPGPAGLRPGPRPRRGADSGRAGTGPHPGRALPDAGASGPGRDGGGVAGLRSEAARGRGAEGGPARASGERAGAGHAPAGGALGPGGGVSERVPDLRPGGGGGPGAGVDGVHRRDHAGRHPARARPARASGGAGDRVSVPVGPGGDPPGGPGAPGLQAGERDADPRGAGGGDGLRPGQGPGRGGDGNDLGHSRLHVAGAGAWGVGGCPGGRVLRGSRV